MKQLISIALLGVATLTASAQQTTQVLQNYDVELLIFRTLNPNASPEEWSMEAAAAGQRLAVPEDEAPAVAAPAAQGLAPPEDEPPPFAAPEPAPTTTATFPALGPAKFKLTAIADTLKRS